jgi:hypothetical protein
VIDADGRATIGLTGTKVASALTGSTEATIEIVATIANASPAGSRLIHMGTGTARGDFSLRVVTQNRLDLAWADGLAAEWPFAAGDRMVIHLVVDTQAVEGQNRARLFIDGLEASPMSLIPIPMGDTLSFSNSSQLALANRGDGNRSFAGMLGYAAIYSVKLTADEIENNVARLAADDDGP